MMSKTTLIAGNKPEHVAAIQKAATEVPDLGVTPARSSGLNRVRTWFGGASRRDPVVVPPYDISI